MKVLVKPTAVKVASCSNYKPCFPFQVDCPTPTGSKTGDARSSKK